MNSRIVSALALAVLVLGAAAGLRYAETAGLLGPDMADRAMQVLVGLVLAAYANLMPKQLDRPRGSVRAEAWAQSVRRVGGWSMTLGGLAWAVIWAVAPMALTRPLAITAVATATAVTLGYALWTWRRCASLQQGRSS